MFLHLFTHTYQNNYTYNHLSFSLLHVSSSYFYIYTHILHIFSICTYIIFKISYRFLIHLNNVYIYIYYKSDITSKSNKQNLQSWLELYYDQILFTKSYRIFIYKIFLSFLLPIFLVYLYLWFSFKSCSITTTRISLRI